MRPIQSLVRLPRSHIDPDCHPPWSGESRIQPQEFYEWAADNTLSATHASGKSNGKPANNL